LKQYVKPDLGTFKGNKTALSIAYGLTEIREFVCWDNLTDGTALDESLAMPTAHS